VIKLFAVQCLHSRDSVLHPVFKHKRAGDDATFGGVKHWREASIDRLQRFRRFCRWALLNHAIPCTRSPQLQLTSNACSHLCAPCLRITACVQALVLWGRPIVSIVFACCYDATATTSDWRFHGFYQRSHNGVLCWTQRMH